MTTINVDWQVHAQQLADRLAEAGVLQDPAWRAAVQAVPRHAFVPRFYRQQPNGDWAMTDAESGSWLEQVYQDIPLITDLAEAENGRLVTVSSSTKPALMLRMLLALDVHDGHRMLEIGTGTGYNAGLLAHRLGDAQVFSIDIGAKLVEAAGQRLAQLGYQPTLAPANGVEGLPEYAPYDRLIATCSVPTVPWAWAEQVREDGLILVDVKHGTHAGNLVLLRRHPHRLEGRFLPRWAGFMAMRPSDSAPPSAHRARFEPEDGEATQTMLAPEPWQSPIPWFLASGRLPRQLTFGHLGFDNGAPNWATYTGDDGSWCAVRMQPDNRGWREVRQGGPTEIWTQFEHVHHQWRELGRPDWHRFGLTVTRQEGHQVWLDTPAGRVWQVGDQNSR